MEKACGNELIGDEMNLTHEEVRALQLEFQKDFDNRYVLQSDCDDVQRSTAKKLANDDKRIENLLYRMNIWNKLLWTIATTSVGALAASVLELILK